MKLLTRDTDYAVRALIFIAGQKGERASVTQLVKDMDIPRPFLRKILQELNRKKILRSSKGRGGGFSLALKPERIYLSDLINIFQGSLRINECMFRKRACPRKGYCGLRHRLQGIEDYVVSKINGITIGSLLKKG